MKKHLSAKDGVHARTSSSLSLSLSLSHCISDLIGRDTESGDDISSVGWCEGKKERERARMA